MFVNFNGSFCVSISVCTQTCSTISHFITKSNPVVSYIVATTKDLQIVTYNNTTPTITTIRDKSLNHLINVKRLLTLSKSFRIDHVRFHSKVREWRRISLHQTSPSTLQSWRQSTFHWNVEGRNRDSWPSAYCDCTSPMQSHPQN